MRKFLPGLLCVFAAVAAEAATISITPSNVGEHRTLQDGNTYVFAEDVEFAAEICTSALSVADGATVEIRVSEGVKVKLTGGAGDGTAGAGAGIEVPTNATLVISGAGELTAIGGAGGGGANGMQGGAGVTGRDDNYSTTSSGGVGGAGGGGGGAGIGGAGGAGGDQGGAGGSAFRAGYRDPVPGHPGLPGKPGASGGGCGAVEVRETVTVIAIGGAAGAKGKGGSKTNWSAQDGYSWNWAAYGSGGGGGGGGGCSGVGVGGGGGGGGAGGGGGGGGLSWTATANDSDCCKYMKNGLGGSGGQSDSGSVGNPGFDRRGDLATLDGQNFYVAETLSDGYGRGGEGGAGGAAGARGADGTVTVAPTARLIADEAGAYDVGQISDTERIRWESGTLYRIKDGAPPEEITYTLVDDNPSPYLDSGKWYVVRGKVQLDFLRLKGGSAVVNLVLLYSSKLTVGGSSDNPGILVADNQTLNIFGAGDGVLEAKGGVHSAGIGGESGSSCGTVTIYGGTVTATGGVGGAGIGGGANGSGGAVTINGGMVTAQGGDYGAGIGSGSNPNRQDRNGGAVTINGGTVMATGGENAADIGGGYCSRDATVTINGGNVVANSIRGQPKNAKTDALYRVTVKCPGLIVERGGKSGERGGLRIEGLGEYGTRDVYPLEDGRIVLWLPKGDCRFAVADSRKSYRYHAAVSGNDFTVEPLGDLGLVVNGEDVGSGSGHGWSCVGSVLNLNAEMTYVLSGESREEAPIQVSLNASGATVVLSNAVIRTVGNPALTVKEGVSATLQMSGGASYLMATDYASAVSVETDAALAVDLAPTGSRLGTMVGVCNSGFAPAISARNGRVVVNGGTFAVWGDSQAVEPMLEVGPDEAMVAGESFESAKYTNSPGYPCVLVGPAVTVMVPNTVPNVRDIVVSNNVQRLQPTVAGGGVYRVMQNDDVFVGYAAAEMYVAVGENPVSRRSIVDNAVIKADEFRVSAVRLLDDGHHYLESTATGKQWIDTGYHPKTTTQIEADFHSLTKTDDWAAFFGVTESDKSNDGVLLRYFRDSRINGWFCNDAYEEACKEGLENTRILAGLKPGAMTLNGETVGISTNPANMPYDGGIYVFCENWGGRAERHQAMRLYAFRIWDVVEGKEQLVRDLVPFVSEDESVCGLFDRVTKSTCLNRGTGAFALGYDPGTRYRIWDETARAMRDRVCPDPIVVTSATDIFEDGKWYAVTGTVSRGTITVKGNAHLILCDGAKLTAAGVTNEAGIAVAVGNSLTIYGQTLGTGELEAKNTWWSGHDGAGGAGIGGRSGGAGGAVTINGGVITAKSVNRGAGIGGGSFGAGGTVTINGGRVDAHGGPYAAGIGGGEGRAGGSVTINGGTVSATHSYTASDIGNSGKAAGATVTINGGSVKAVTVKNAPMNAAGASLYCVKVECPGLSGEGGGKSEEGRGLRFEGLGDYGLNDVRAVNGELYLWLPVGKYSFRVSDGKTTYSYFAAVNGCQQNLTVKPLTEADVRVNGSDIFAVGSGTGWEYDFIERVLTLTGGTDYVITGVSTGDLVRIVVTADANVTFSNATIQASSDAVITVEGDHTLFLSAGVGEDAAYLLGEGQNNVIAGGTTVVGSGSVCLWAERAIPVDCGDGKFSVAPGEIMCVGADAGHLSYVGSYGKNDSDRILLVGPRYRLEGPSVENATVEVWSQPECLGSRKDGAWSYDLMLGDTAIVRVIPDAGYVLRGAPAEQCFEVDGDRMLDLSELPVALLGLHANYRTATVDLTTAAVDNSPAAVDAVLFDEVTNRLETVGRGAYGEEWYVVTGQLECASFCVTTGTVNLILYPGASLTLWGEDGQPGLGVMPNASLNIYGCEDGVGTLVAFGGTYAAGIGGGGSWVMDGVPEADAGWITVNGGQVTAVGGSFGAGIGGGACGAGAYLEVNGGSVLAYGGYDAEDIGGGSYGEDGVTVVNGGNVTANSVEAKPVNAAGTKLYRVYVVSENFIPTNDVPLAVKGLGGFGTADVFANEDGAICFYLPNGHYEFTVDGWKCVADVQDGTASAEVSEERGGESGENEGESEEGGGNRAEVLGIEVGKKVLVTVRSKMDWTYRLRRVTFEGGNVVVGDVVWFATADGDTLTLRDDEPPAGSGFYVVEESEW